MKKLLLILMLVAVSAIVWVGCTSVTPPVNPPPVAGVDCPTSVVVSGEVSIAGKNYIQGGEEKTITVTFAVPTAPVSVYIGHGIADNMIATTGGVESKPAGKVPEYADEVVMYTTDNKVYTGTYTFFDDNTIFNSIDGEDFDCAADYIYVETCGTCAACKYPYTVDSEAPYAEFVVCGVKASCPGCGLSFSSTIGGTCAPEETCEDCVGLASWTIDLYDDMPNFEACGCIPCEKPIETGTGTTCPVNWTSAYSEKIQEQGMAWAVVTLVDLLGNSTTFGYQIGIDENCQVISITDLDDIQSTECLEEAPEIHPCAPCDGSQPVNGGGEAYPVPEPVDLGTTESEGFVILSKSGITNVPTSLITGDIGTSPITGASITGLDNCLQVVGTIYTVDAAGPLCRVVDPTRLTAAVSAMEAAYTAAAGLTNPTATELDGGLIGGRTLAPGLYKWSTDVNIQTNVTLSGGAGDVWVFQIAGNLSIASGGSVPAGIKIILAGGAQASNIFWQVGGTVGATLGTYSTFYGTILSQNDIIIQTGAVLNGRAWAQKSVTLDKNIVTQP